MKNIAALLLLASLLLTGCLVLPPGNEPKRDTPRNTLELLVNAWETQSDSLFDLTMDDNFIFFFDEKDHDRIINGYRVTGTWNLYEETQATRHIFTSVSSIDLVLDLDSMEQFDAGSSSYESGWLDYHLYLHYSDSNDSVAIGQARFLLKNNGEDGWQIEQWEDFYNTQGDISWGYLKAWYRKN